MALKKHVIWQLGGSEKRRSVRSVLEIIVVKLELYELYFWLELHEL